MAELSPVLRPHRDEGSRLGYTMFPTSECESEAELSLSLARTKTRSYGSTANVTAPWAERFIEHPVSPSDTLQGIALKYGVTYIEAAESRSELNPSVSCTDGSAERKSLRSIQESKFCSDQAKIESILDVTRKVHDISARVGSALMELLHSSLFHYTSGEEYFTFMSRESVVNLVIVT
ncbi:lysM and putative peptidoglycan-binding domain-containing protein 2 isoform X2 [Rhinoderma darwinii]|uniref:lysM and putative peptidoglycan-binding domain-containing protein 2 isoform X2 n=1 Tax=Rhinoderma darwinii TaxID=43563 RepID=UPI003F6761C7